MPFTASAVRVLCVKGLRACSDITLLAPASQDGGDPVTKPHTSLSVLGTRPLRTAA